MSFNISHQNHTSKPGIPPQTVPTTTPQSSAQSTTFANQASTPDLNARLLQLIALLVQLLISQLQQQSGTPTPPDGNTGTESNPDTHDCEQEQVKANLTQASVFNTPVGADQPGPIRPGQSVEVDFTAQPGQNISFASMYAPTNDYFFAAGDSGIPVYDADGNPVSGDVSDAVHLWDSGTEADERPFEGRFQTMDRTAMIVAEPNTGPVDPVNQVRKVDQAWGLPATDQLVKAEIIHKGGDQFTFRLTNVSGQTVDASPNSPGVLLVHNDNVKPLFTENAADRGWGLEGIAEDGNPAALAGFYNNLLGITTPVTETAH